MKTSELYQAGKLQEAIDAQIAEVKRAPADGGKRVFLFELLAYAGELDRAAKHINVLKFEDVELEATRQSYLDCLAAERKRRKCFAFGTAPQFLAPPPDHVRLRLEAVGRYRQEQPDEAAKLIHEAFEATPVVGVTINETKYESFRDGDDLLAGVLEVFARGEYFWVPLEQILRLALSPPKTPRDLLWRAARLEMTEAVGEVFLPTLYPKTHLCDNESLKLGRETDWQEFPGEIVLGLGLKEFFAGEDPSVIHDWLTVEIDGPESEEPPVAEAEPAAEGETPADE